MARTTSDFGRGSGDIALACSTARTSPQQDAGRLLAQPLLHEVRWKRFRGCSPGD